MAQRRFRSPARFLPVLLLLAMPLRPAEAQSSQALAWTRWEAPLTSTNAYANPYRNLRLQVSWTCIANCSTLAWGGKLPVVGFWDGGTSGRTFKLRAMFPQPTGSAATAQWQWTTTWACTGEGQGGADCALATGTASHENGLNASGIVQVTRSTTANGVSNALYLGGYFGFGEWITSESGQLVRGNGHLLNDNGPFYWLGDTAWAAPVRATFNAGSTPNCAQASGWTSNDWKCYVLDRKARSFSAIQVSVPQWWMKNPLTDSAGQAPFVANSSFPAWSKWNPTFWQSFEAKVQYANEQGLVVVVVGLMEPSYQYLATDNPTPGQRYPPEADAKIFARNLAARLAGNFVILAPGFDTRPDAGAKSALIRAVGSEIHGVSPRFVATNHFGGSTPVAVSTGGVYNDYQDFESEPWMDIHLFQSGQCRNLDNGQQATVAQQLQNFTNRARQMPLDLRVMPRRLPTGNAEAIYDNEGAVLEAGQSAPDNAAYYRPYRVRQTAYLSTLSGAFGYTMGVYGLWDWGLGDGAGPYQPRSPRNSVNRPSTAQLQALATLFRDRLRFWYRLAPKPALITNNPTEPNPSNPVNQHLQMVVSREVTRRTVVAYLPDDGEIRLQLPAALYPGLTTTRWRKEFWNPRTGTIDTQPVSFTLVGGTADTYRVPRPACLAGQPCTGQNGDRDWVLILTDTSQGAAAWVTQLAATSLQAWAVWDPVSSLWSIRAQLFDGSEAPVGSEVLLSDETAAPQRLPQVAHNSQGGFLVVWEAVDPTGNGPVILGQVVSEGGVTQGSPLVLNDSKVGVPEEPVVSADGAGQFVVAWVLRDPETGESKVLARRLGKDGLPVSSEAPVHGGSLLARSAPLVSAEPGGGFAVAWQSDDPLTGASSVLVQRFDDKGVPSGAALTVATSASEALALESLTTDALGNFTVVWQPLVAGEGQGHFSRSYDALARSFGAAAQVADPWL